MIKNPGGAYWSKVSTLKDRYSTQSKDRLQSEISKGTERWKQVKLVESAYTLTIRDFVFVNIDSDDKLAMVVLSTDSIRK